MEQGGEGRGEPYFGKEFLSDFVKGFSGKSYPISPFRPRSAEHGSSGGRFTATTIDFQRSLRRFDAYSLYTVLAERP